MKLNATAEMLPITCRNSPRCTHSRGRSGLGYAEIIEDLSSKLCQITGYDAFSLQPNSGAKANMRDYSRSALIIAVAATNIATSASFRRRLTAPIPLPLRCAE